MINTLSLFGQKIKQGYYIWCGPTEITSYMYLGAMKDIPEFITKCNEKGIQPSVLSIIQEPTIHKFLHDNYITINKHCIIPISDDGDIKIKREVLPRAFEFIDQAKTNQEMVLVHCQSGLSRSPTVIIAYLIGKEREFLDEHKKKFTNSSLFDLAYNYVAERRGVLNINAGFLRKLIELGSKSKSNDIVTANYQMK